MEWLIKSEKIDITVNPKKRLHCEDFGDRKGCGVEVKVIQNSRGKKVATTPVQIPCYDREGNTVWAYVPHWVICPDSRDYLINFMQTKAKEEAEYQANKNKGQGPERAEAPF